MKRIAIGLLVAGTILLLAACGDDDTVEETPANTETEVINPAEFSAELTNPLFPLSSFSKQVYEGAETDPETGETTSTRVEITVLPDEKTVAGVKVLVVRDDAYEDGELVESTLDYFAQHDDGSVYYFGEDVDNYEDGELKDHEGSWLAGEGSIGLVFMAVAAVDSTIGSQKQFVTLPGWLQGRVEVLGIQIGLYPKLHHRRVRGDRHRLAAGRPQPASAAACAPPSTTPGWRKARAFPWTKLCTHVRGRLRACRARRRARRRDPRARSHVSVQIHDLLFDRRHRRRDNEHHGTVPRLTAPRYRRRRRQVLRAEPRRIRDLHVNGRRPGATATRIVRPCP